MHSEHHDMFFFVDVMLVIKEIPKYNPSTSFKWKGRTFQICKGRKWYADFAIIEILYMNRFANYFQFGT